MSAGSWLAMARRLASCAPARCVQLVIVASAFTHMLIGGAIGLIGVRVYASARLRGAAAGQEKQGRAATAQNVTQARAKVWLPWACALLAAAPDLDVVMHAVVDYSHPFGHRGAFHSLAWYALVAVLVASVSPFRARRWTSTTCFLIAMASHSLLDMLTNGGLGISLWWPLSDVRLFLPWRPIPVSPLSIGRFFTTRGLTILQAELPFAVPLFVFAWVLRPKPRTSGTLDASQRESALRDRVAAPHSGKTAPAEGPPTEALARDEPQPSAGSESEDLAVLEIEDSIDLHGFAPRDILSVVEAYLEAAHDKGFEEVRLIHGRGKGYQRARVQKLLSTHPLVLRYRDAPATRGGWGATIAWLKRDG